MNVSDEDRLSALVSWYSAERSDLASIGNQNIAIVGLALTYIIAVVFGLAQSVDEKGVSIFWLAAPIPLLVFFAFYTLFISLSRARTSACKVLEKRILESAHLGVGQVSIGVTVSDRIMDPNYASRWQTGIILAAYGPIIAAIPIVTISIVIRAIRHDNNLWAVAAFTALYAVLAAPSIWSWLKDFIPIILSKLKAKRAAA